MSEPIRVLVWDERQPEQRAVYPEFLGRAIAEHLARQPGIVARAAALDDPEQGLDPRALDETDVLIWWGHRRHDAVEETRVRGLVQQIADGRLGLLALHSSHWSRPFLAAMAHRTLAQVRADRVEAIAPIRFRAPQLDEAPTPRSEWAEDGRVLRVWLPGCGFPKWRREGGPSCITTLLPKHPIAAGVPASFAMRETEMYSEPFHVPEPDAVVFEERWETGEHFRTGMTWQVGKGRVFYFGPGHETYDVFRQEIPLRIVTNAARWLAEK